MSSISLRVTVPICSFRRPHAREYLESERVPPPSTVYGFLLAMVGEEQRERYIGTQLALALLTEPEVSTVLRTTWRIKSKNTPPGTGENRKPDYQEVLTGLCLAIWVADGSLAARLHAVAEDPKEVRRFGGLSLGESRDLVDEIHFDPLWSGVKGHWLMRDEQGNLPLPVWVDHVGSVGTRWEQFRLLKGVIEEPPPEAMQWATIEPPSPEER